MKLRRSQNIAVISRRWPASIASPSGLETSAATCGERNRASWPRWRSIVSSSRALAMPIAACSPKPTARAVSAAVNGRTSLRVRASTPLIVPSCSHRDAEQGSVAADLLARAGDVLAVRKDVVDADRLADEGDPPHDDSRPGRIGCSRSQASSSGVPPAEAATR